MRPERLRRRLGFATLGVASSALLSASPALAQYPVSSQVFGATPMAIGFGAAGFGVIALVVFRAIVRESKTARQRAAAQIAALRAEVDQYEALLAGTNEVTILWRPDSEGPRLFGQPDAVLPPGRLPEAVLSFELWLQDSAADELAVAVEALRVDGRGFDLSLTSRDGRAIRAIGTVNGGAAAVRLRPARAGTRLSAHGTDARRELLAVLPDPAFLRDAAGRIAYANPAYQALAAACGRDASPDRPPELIDPVTLRRHLAGSAANALRVTVGERAFELIGIATGEGRGGILRPAIERRAQPPAPPAPPVLDRTTGHLGAVIDALWVPVAIFDRNRALVQSNRAYAELWGLDPAWLRPGMEEREILDRLRTDGRLPAEPDYHGWRTKHLEISYGLTAPRESDPWHLPDGRTINVISAPASRDGGVIYVFEDISERLELESRNRALLEVQRSTINSLTEAVAVFGTNGRLTLSNPRLSAIWKLPMNELGNNPHIDRLAAASALSLPADGAAIWRDLKRAVIDLGPSRTDRSGRITRADGRLLDYAVVRLPDGQTMLTFLDVTESANYSRVLKERNDALVTADRLKDAFVQNVSYELRSPLTNIIGFAELLASESVGTLNERQRAYTGYIRASSETLGVLIDNILDLATVDAGISELDPAPQDVAALVEKARAGLLATFPAVDGKPALNLEIDVPEGLPPFVADGTRVVQVLYNLLSSAARFSAPGAPIRLWVRARANRMLFNIDDEGGMPEEVREAILERGADPGLSGRQRGTGLGIAIVRAFVALHGGTITVERREPAGTRVVVSFPRDVAIAGAAE